MLPLQTPQIYFPSVSSFANIWRKQQHLNLINKQVPHTIFWLEFVHLIHKRHFWPFFFGFKSHWQFCLKVCLCLSVSGHHGWIVYREGRDIQRCREPGNHAGNKYYISLVQHFVGQFGNSCQNKQCTRLLGLFSPMFKYTYLLVCSSKIHIRVQ